MDPFEYVVFDKSINDNLELYVSYAIIINGEIGTLCMNLLERRF